MLGIKEIGSYIPEGRIDNFPKKEKFELDEGFLENKLGVKQVSVKAQDEDCSDLCVGAYNNLINKIDINKEQIDVMILITQNPDMKIPHTSAILHNKLNMPKSCACFDVGLGCAGYVYGLSVIKSFMRDNDLKNGLLFTGDPYSKIIDYDDKNTSLLFGDAATVTFISENPLYELESFSFGTAGEGHGELCCPGDKLYMNGRSVFNFVIQNVPGDIKKLLEKNNLTLADIDQYIFHQGSKYIIDMLTKRMSLNPDQVSMDIYDYGNTVSSSIPIILQNEIKDQSNNKILISGFGTGFSWASAILNKIG